MIKLAKKIAQNGAASRREAERLIETGHVWVDGVQILTPLFFAKEDSVITIDGKELAPKPKVRIWKFYKPRGVITSRVDPKGRQTVFDVIRERHPEIKDRLLYIGRLDYNSEGLLLFTNTGVVSREMELPSSRISRTYRVRILGRLNREQIEEIRAGITVDGIHYDRIDVKRVEPATEAANTWLTFSLYEGKNREIRKILSHFGCLVNRLIRVEFGGIQLGDMRPGDLELVFQEE